MVVVTNNPKYWLAGLGVSLAIFLILLFAVILPSNNAANNAVKTGLQQSQQALNQAQSQISNAQKQSGGSSSQASQALSKTQKLTSCLAAAGTDVTKVQACQAQFGH
jgi:type II secretory pathway component PulM